MTLTINKKTYEAGELVAYVAELEKEYASLKGLRKYELNVAKLEIEKLEKENAELRTKTTALENANRAMVKELDDMTSGGVSVLENVVRSKERLNKGVPKTEIAKALKIDRSTLWRYIRGGESVSSVYEIIERIDFIREQKFGFKLSDYISKFEISRRTALRDFNFLNTYRRKPCKVKRISEGIYIYTEEKLK